MTKSQEISIKLSETRQAINGLLQKETRTDEETNRLDALTKQIQRNETEFRAAVTAENVALDDAADLFGDDGEAVELRQLRGKVKLQNYIIAATESRAARGAESEYNQALDIGGNQFPLSLLAPAPAVEQRTTTNTDGAANQQSWLDRLFADTAAAYLGINFQSAGPGKAAFPVTTAGASAAQRARAEDASAAAWTVGVTELQPTRNTVHAIFSKEDDLRLVGLEAALLRDLRMALTEGIDRVIFTGDSGADENVADVAGLNSITGVTDLSLTQAKKLLPADTLGVFTGLIDGKHASGQDDLRIIASEGSHVLWHSTILQSTTSIRTVANFLGENGVMWRVRQLENATSNGKWGCFASRARGLSGASAAPVWNAGELIRDPYTKAKSGECLLTLSYYWNFSLPRASNFARLKYVT